ncbi:MAG TPA: hypothetical protein DCS93_30385 [Microscillaceae bacterium]|nr:hypothetical protein [Microscillaceae bacterium]
MKSNQALLSFHHKLIILLFTYALIIGLAGFNILARIGFTSYLFETLAIAGLALFCSNLLIVPELFKRNHPWLHFHTLLLLFFLSIILVSYLPSWVRLVFFYSYVLLGFSVALWVVYQFFAKLSLKTILLLLPVPILLAIKIVGAFYDYGTLNPLFLEKIALGIGHQDTLMHMSITQMFKTHHIASTGLDGIPFVHYHFGSHYFFARLSFFSGLSVMHIYHLAFPVCIIPLYFLLLLYTVLRLTTILNTQPLNLQITQTKGLVFWGIFLVAHLGMLPDDYLQRTVSWQSYLGSESYLVALILMFTTLSYLLDYRHLQEGTTSKTMYKVLLTVLVLVICLCKVSVGLLLIAIVAYLQWKEGQLFRWKNLLFWLVSLGLLYVLYQAFIAGFGRKTDIHFFHFFRRYTDYPIRFYIVPIHFFALILFILLHLYQVEKNNPEASLPKLIRDKQTLWLEVILLLGVLSLLPGLILAIPDGSAIYFSDVARRVSIVLLLAITPFVSQLIHRSLTITKRVIIILLIFPLAATLFSNAKNTFWKVLYESVDIRVTLKPQGQRLRFAYTQMQSALEKRPEYQFLKQLDSLNQLPVSEKRKMLIHIPQADTAYYNHLQGASWASSFLVPALTGIPLINGLPPQKEAKNKQTYTLFTYHMASRRAKVPWIGADDRSAIRERARKLGVKDKKILRLTTTFQDLKTSEPLVH